jgi:alkylation response protein AidB-like acyl-CoA dehydrogenase
MLDEVWQWASRTRCEEGGTMLEQQWVQIQLARVQAKLKALQVLNWRSAWSLSEGHPNLAEASALKVMGTEFFVEAYNLLLEITSAAGIAVEGQPGCLFGGRLEAAYRSATTLTFGGGVNEVQRDIVAMAGLGLPRARARK